MSNHEIAKNLSNDEITKWLVYCSSSEKDCYNKCIFNGIDFNSMLNKDDCYNILMREAATRISSIKCKGL